MLSDSVASLYSPNETLASSISSSQVLLKPETKRGFFGITIEPALLFYTFAVTLSSIFVKNIMVDKVCLIYYNYSDYTCANIDSNNFTEEQQNVQQVVNRYVTYQYLIENIPGLYVTLAISNWMEYKSKVFPLILAHSMPLVQSLIYLANSYWFSIPPAWLLLAEVPNGLAGGLMVIILTSFSIVADNSKARSRTIRMVILQTVFDIAFPLGYYLGTVFYQIGGYNLVFSVQCFVNALDLIYIILFCMLCTNELSSDDSYCEIIDVDGSSVEFADNDLIEVDSQPSIDKNHYSSPLWKIFSPMFMYGQIKRTFDVENRSKMLGLCLVHGLVTFAFTSGTYAFLYTRLKFSWTYLDFTEWVIFTFILASAGSLILVPFLSYLCQVPDVALNMGANLSCATGAFLIAAAPTASYMYYASFSNILGGTNPVTYIRSAISKLVPSENLPTALATLGVVGSVAMMTSSLLDTLIYNWTIESFPGTVFVIAGCMHLTGIGILWFIFKEKKPPIAESEENTPPEVSFGEDQ